MAIDPNKIGFSQFVDTFDGQKGNLKEKPGANGGTTIYMSNKTFHSFLHNDAEKDAHRQKLQGPVPHVKTALANEFGSGFATAAFEKLAAKKNVAPDQITSLSHKDLKDLQKMTEASKAQAAKEFSPDSLPFLETVTKFGALQDPAEIRTAYEGIMRTCLANKDQCEEFGFDEGAADRNEVNIGWTLKKEAAQVYRDLQATPANQPPSAALVERMQAVVDKSGAEIRSLVNDMTIRLTNNESWENLKL